MADRVAVLKDGRLMQLADPMTLYKHPVDRFVADFIGRVNFFDVEAFTPGSAEVRVQSLGSVVLPQPVEFAAGEKLVLAVRPEYMRIRPWDGTGVPGKLGDVGFQGDSSIVEVTLESGQVVQALSGIRETPVLLGLEPGAKVSVDVDLGGRAGFAGVEPLNHHLQLLLRADPEHPFVAGDLGLGAHGFSGVVGEFDGGAAVGGDGLADEREGREGVVGGQAAEVVGQQRAPAERDADPALEAGMQFEDLVHVEAVGEDDELFRGSSPRSFHQSDGDFGPFGRVA